MPSPVPKGPADGSKRLSKSTRARVAHAARAKDPVRQRLAKEVESVALAVEWTQTALGRLQHPLSADAAAILLRALTYEVLKAAAPVPSEEDETDATPAAE